MTYVDAAVAQKLINETTHTKISGRKVDLRKAELKTSEKMELLNKAERASGGNNSGKEPGQGHHHSHHNNNGSNNYGGSNSNKKDQDRGGANNRSSGSN